MYIWRNYLSSSKTIENMKNAISKLDIYQQKPYLLFYLVTKYIGKWKVDYVHKG